MNQQKQTKMISAGIYHTQDKKVVNGVVRIVDTFNFPSNMISEERVIWLTNRGWNERAAVMIAFNISESEMQRIEND